MKKKVLIILLALVSALTSILTLSACEHTHAAKDAWKHDSAYHWHGCTGFLCFEKLDMAEHTLEHVEGKEPDCTEGGNLDYWFCTVCNACFTDQAATAELTDVELAPLGHSPVYICDENSHYQVCETCGETLSASQPHGAPSYIKNKDGHYKVCADCGTEFARGAHTQGNACTVCGYTSNYVDMCSSYYGYKYLATLENGSAYQSFYEKIDKVATSFHNSSTQSASSVSVGGATIYVADDINYSSLKLSIDEAISVWATYRYDHPLFYWMSGQIVYSTASISLCVESSYVSGSARSAQNLNIYAAIDEYVSAAGDLTDDYQTAFALHDAIISKIDYAKDEEGNPVTESWAHSIEGVFTKNSAVCEGYAKAFSLLLNACGVYNAYVTGSSRGEGHAWNIVEIDGAWYWYDLTWDDQPQIDGGIIYDYMCKPGETFEAHVVGAIGDMTDAINYLYALPAAATQEYDSAAPEQGEQFTLGNFTYEVSGYNKVALISSSGVSGAVELADSVTCGGRTFALAEIGSGAFSNNTKITGITIPQSVELINSFAFKGCTRLTRATFADKEGWQRTAQDVTESISSARLENASDAATLIKENYRVMLTSYAYVWVKK